jgi:transposase
MGVPLVIRKDLQAAELRRLTWHERDGRVAARLLALANVLDGMSRAAAARAAGMARQMLREWVIRFNAAGVDGLRDQPRPGRPARMTESQQATLKAIVLRGPDSERDGVSSWRIVGLCRLAAERFGVSSHEAACSGWSRRSTSPGGRLDHPIPMQTGRRRRGSKQGLAAALSEVARRPPEALVPGRGQG